MTTITELTDLNRMPNASQDQAVFDANWAYVLERLPERARQENLLLASLNSIAAGRAYAMPYSFNSNTADADPGWGVLRLSSATQNASTALRIDTNDSVGIDWSALFNSIGSGSSSVKGSVRIVKMTEPSKFLVFDITAVNALTGYFNLTLVHRVGTAASPFAGGDALMLFFDRNGDKGDTGVMGIYPAAKFSDRKTAGTSAGDSIAGTQTRTLNTAEYNTIAGASMSGNQITLPAGTYEVSGRVPGYAVNGHKAFFYNVSDGAPAIVGSSASSPNPSGTQTDSVFDGRITITATKVFSIRHYTETAALGSALGRAANGSGQHEVFAEITLTKIA